MISATRETPANEEEAADIVRRAIATGRTLAPSGGGTRSGLGRSAPADAILGSEGLTGVSLYEPAELVIGAGAGTPIAEIETLLASNGQQFAFEPMDHRSLFGTAGEPTIGGVAGTNSSGPRRVKVGAARDALLGLRFINGLGEVVKTGGRVMKNVTGLDLVKALCGSHGTLAFTTEIVFKVMPISERSVTISFPDLDDPDAVAAMSSALGSPYEPSGAAHLPAGLGSSNARTLIRLEGFDDSVRHRVTAMNARLRPFGESELLEGSASDALWRQVRDASFLTEPRDRAIWRVSTIPRQAVVAMVGIANEMDARWFYDWGGGLVWLSVDAVGDAGAATIRRAIGATGHATLIRAPDTIRDVVPVFQPLDAQLMALTAGIKRSFDPHGVFQPGRMYADI